MPAPFDAYSVMYALSRRLGMPVDAPRDITSLDDYINDELMRRLDVVQWGIKSQWSDSIFKL